jgi:hypothetical protein
MGLPDEFSVWQEEIIKEIRSNSPEARQRTFRQTDFETSILIDFYPEKHKKRASEYKNCLLFF